MKKSLELLGVKSSSLEILQSSLDFPRNDDEAFNEAIKLTDLVKREAYLRKFLEKDTNKYSRCIKSKRLLIELIKTNDPKYASDLLFSICRESPFDPDGYLLFAEMAIEDKAWLVAKSLLEVVKWLCQPDNKNLIEKTERLFELVLDKISKAEQDNSNNDFWKNKTLGKYWILEKIYHRSKLKKLIEYSFKLLKIFPDDKKNYEIVYKILSLTEDKKSINDFIKHLKENLNEDTVSLNLYLGMAYHSLSELDTSSDHLQEVLSVEKGNAWALFYLALNNLMTSNVKNFISTYEKIIPPSETSFTALFFIYSAIVDFKLDEIEFPDQKNISYEVSKILSKLLVYKQSDLIDFLIKKFKELNYHIILPYLFLYLAELFIKENKFDEAKKLLELSKNDEVHRLYAWMYRLEGRGDLAEQELVKYRTNWKPNTSAGIICHAVSLNLPDKVPDNPEEIFNLISDAYTQTKELIHSFDLEYGLDGMTCIETACQDCCTKTYPYISYTEYLYLKNWLDSQPKELRDQIRERSVQVVKTYKTRFGKEAPFMTGETIDAHKEYPQDFTFDCPNLGNNKCNVYEARPFTCRVYSYASQNGARFKGCSYFFEQFKGATKLHDVRKVINMESFTEFVKLTDKELIGKRVVAPIPVWFAQSHKETMEKIKKL